MKTFTIKSLAGSTLAVLTVLLAPVSVNALSLPSVQIHGNGNVNLSGVQVTSTSGNTINGVIAFPNAATTTVTITANADTKVQSSSNSSSSNHTPSSSLADIKVGDFLNISGIFTGFSTSLSITARTIHEITSFISFRAKSGTVQSVNVANNTFVLKMANNRLLTVQANASTTILLGNKATSTLATAVTVNSKVEVRGLMNTDGTVFTASKVVVKLQEQKKEKNENKNDNDRHEDNGKKGAEKKNIKR